MVTVTVEKEGSTGVITVMDDGDGVEGADLERVFQPGVRVAPSASDKTAGLGLARRLAEAAGGTIVAHSGPGGRFTVRLPLA
jgi:signal transduction histidine kinase